MQMIPVMTFESVVEYFVTARPNDHRVVCGAILRRSHPKGLLLVQVFLNREMKPVEGRDGKIYGREVVVKELDAELKDAFGHEDMIIFD